MVLSSISIIRTPRNDFGSVLLALRGGCLGFKRGAIRSLAGVLQLSSGFHVSFLQGLSLGRSRFWALDMLSGSQDSGFGVQKLTDSRMQVAQALNSQSHGLGFRILAATSDLQCSAKL